jgi:hypothetical protein
VFTCFDIQTQPEMLATVIPHDFPFIKSLGYASEVDSERVDYLGSPLSERGLLSLDDELSLICHTARHYASEDRAFRYLAHRDDSEEKLKRIREGAGEVERPDLPAEVYFLVQPTMPAIVASAVSTALHNVFRILPQLVAQLVVIPSHLFRDGKHSADEVLHRYQRVRREYEAAGIQVLSLDFHEKL